MVFKCYCVASVTKTFTLKGVQGVERWKVCTSFEYKRFRNAHHTVTFEIPL
jgi:hypothetical protein